MDRRTFSRSLAGLPLATSAFAQASLLPARRAIPRDLATFTYSGKEEQPFLHDPEGVLASHDGSGYLDHMWFGGSFPDYTDLRVRIYVDRETAPAIDMKLGMGAGVGFADPFAPWGTRFSGITGAPSGIYLNYRIPFSTHVRVTAELPAGAPRGSVFWWIVRGLENNPLEVAGFQLPATTRLRLHKLEDFDAQPLQEFDLCRIPGAGLIFQVAMAAKSASFQFMEGQMRAYMADAVNPQFLSSGLEDYFLGTYYFNRGLYHLPQAGLTHKNPADGSFSAYRFHEEDPIVFPHGIRLACRCGEERGGKIFGGPGAPHPTTYTAYTWAYEW